MDRTELQALVEAVLEQPRSMPGRLDTIMRGADEYAITMHRRHQARPPVEVVPVRSDAL